VRGTSPVFAERKSPRRTTTVSERSDSLLSSVYMATTQAPRQDKYTHWAFTAFDAHEIELLDVSGNLPKFVKTVYGGPEICKATGRRHFQGHIHCRSPQRFAAIKKWLPLAHIEPARDPHASIQYALKKDTADGEKKSQVNPSPYLTDRMAMEKLVEKCNQFCECKFWETSEKQTLCIIDDKEDYWHRVRSILRTEPDLCGLYAKPDLYRLWKNTKSVWFERKRASIVLPSSLEFPQGTNEIIFSLDNTNGEVRTSPVCKEDTPLGSTERSSFSDVVPDRIDFN